MLDNLGFSGHSRLGQDVVHYNCDALSFCTSTVLLIVGKVYDACELHQAASLLPLLTLAYSVLCGVLDWSPQK